MKKECVEVEIQLNGNLIILNRAVPIQKEHKRNYAHLKLTDQKLRSDELDQFRNGAGTIEVWVREVTSQKRTSKP